MSRRHMLKFELELEPDVDARTVARTLRAALPAGPAVRVLGVEVLREAAPNWRLVEVIAASGRGRGENMGRGFRMRDLVCRLAVWSITLPPFWHFDAAAAERRVNIVVAYLHGLL